MKIAIFPGSFDPITIGHVNIIERALPLFDKIIIAIGVNTEKKYFYPLEQRVKWLKDIFKDEDRVEVDSYQGLTVTYCQKVGARYIVRGLRNNMDFDFEKTIAQMNVKIGDGIETIFLMSDPDLSPISSSILREIIKSGGDATPFLPKEVR